MQKHTTNNECIGGITATSDVSFRKDGIKHKLVASGIMRNGIEGTNYWNSKDQVVIETNIPASLNPIEKLTALKEYVNSQPLMGSTGSFVPYGKKPKEVVLEYNNSHRQEGQEWKILKHKSTRGDGYNWSNVIYAAYQLPSSKVVGLVICYKYYPKDREVVHKEMTENEHPYFYECPNNILDMLSETDNKNALEWRANCREFNAQPKPKKLEDGDKVRFPNGFGTLPADMVFTVSKINRTIRFLSGGVRYNLQGWRKRTYEIVG